MNKRNILVVSALKHIQLSFAATVISLLAASPVHAADDSSSSLDLGVSGLVWLWALFALVFGIILFQNKLTRRGKNHHLNDTTPTSTDLETTSTEDQADVQDPAATDAATTATLAEAVASPEISSHEAENDIQSSEIVEPDALEEANKLLAQDRLPQAVGTLSKGLQKNPDRSDLMLQLLDIYQKQNDVEAFDAQFEQLKQLDDSLALIQAEELRSQLTRTANVEKSDIDNNTINFDINDAIIPEPESATPTPYHYTAESLDFTLEKTQTDEMVTSQLDSIVTQTETDDLVVADAISSIALEQPVSAITEHDFVLDDIDLKPAVVLDNGNHSDVVDKLTLGDLAFSELSLQIPETSELILQTPETSESEAVEPTPSDVTSARESEHKILTHQSKESALLDLDLDFDFDDSFAIDEETQESTKSEKTEWTTDLADESFVSTDTVPAVVQELGEPITGVRLSALEVEFPFLQSVDIFQTRLDLARSYMILGEIDSARELLNEVAEEGASAQQSEARALIAQLAS
jgi:pilus assembly protein FimV